MWSPAIYTFPDGSTGAQGVQQIAQAPTLSQIFGGSSVIYAGQSFTIEEQLRIVTQIDDYTLLRQEDRWFEPKQYIGTWQRIAPDGLITHNNTDYGLIRSTVFTLNHYATWSLGSDPNNPVQLADGGSLSQCNFELETAEVSVMGASVAGSAPTQSADLLTFEGWRQPTSVQDYPYPVWFSGVGLYLYPGCSVKSLQLSASVINVAYNADSPWVPRICSLGDTPCVLEFRAWVASQQNGLPIDTPVDQGGLIFTTPTTPFAGANNGIATLLGDTYNGQAPNCSVSFYLFSPSLPNGY